MFYSEGKGDNIKREFTIKDYLEGGLRMIDINTFKSLKASWMKKYLDPKNNGKWFFYGSLKMYGGELIFSCNLHKDDISWLRMSNPFVCEVLSTWAKLNCSASVMVFAKFLI